MLLMIALVLGQLGTDILVNDDTSGGCLQQYPAVTCDDSGNFYCVWTDSRTSDYDSDIFLQRLDRNGLKEGQNLNLIADQPSRDIWSYSDGRSDINFTGNHLLLAVRDKRRGDYDIYYEVFDRQMNLISPLVMVNDDWSQADQDNPKTASAGAYQLIVWEDWREGGRTIYGQIFDSVFQPTGANFRVCDNAGVDQANPAVAGSDNGFTVVWQETQNGTSHIQGRMFEPNGNPYGASFTALPASSANPFCTMDASGYFWVGGEATGTSVGTVWIRLYDPLGRSVIGPLAVCDSTTRVCPRMAEASTLRDRSRTLVTWLDAGTPPFRVIGQFLDAQGNKVGGSFPVSAATWLTTPVCACVSESSYIVAWEDSRAGDQDIYCYAPRQGEARLNDDYASAIQDFPCIGMDSSGTSLLVWYDFRNGANDADIYAQRYDNRTLPIGTNFRVNDDGPGNEQYFPWLAVSKTGRAIAVWRDNRQGDFRIFGQIFDESGNRIGDNFCANDSGVDDCWPTVSIDDASQHFLVSWFGPGEAWCRPYRMDGTPLRQPVHLMNNVSIVSCVAGTDDIWWVSWIRNGQIYLQRVDSLCRPLTGPIRVSETAHATRVFMSRDTWDVVWLSWMDSRSGNTELYGQRYSWGDGLIGGEFKINDDNVGCEHDFPAWASDGGRMYVTFTDFRIEGDLNIMAQIFGHTGERIGSNFIVNHDPRFGVHQWAWQSVAASRDYVGYVWEDNRNLRSWDIYFQLETTTAGLPTPNPDTVSRVSLQPSVLRAGSPLFLEISPVPGRTVIRLFDRSGNLIRELFSGSGQSRLTLKSEGLPSGVYFLTTSFNRGQFTNKFVIIR